MADAMMMFLGEAHGVKWYWAQPGEFENPGVYYWDGAKNVLCVPHLAAAPEAPAKAEPGVFRNTLRLSLDHPNQPAQAEQAAEPVRDEREPSPTAGMTLGQRILHVGGRNNAAGYVEFGSIQAVDALVRHVLRDLPDSAALASTERQPLTQWQPIETAPKDGTAILVSEGRLIHCVEWNDEYEWWAVDDNKLGPFRLRGSAPTHWMPLPAPLAHGIGGEGQR